MKKFSIFICALFLTLLTTVKAAEAGTAASGISKEKVVEIEKMLRLVGMEKLMEQVKTQMLTALRQQIAGASGDYWKRFEEKFDTRELLQLVMPLYDKYYTMEDLKAINAFYESPAGQKVVTTLPQITQESMKIGQAWGEAMGKRVEREVQEELRQKKENERKI
jgi:hypothetical protein